MSSFHHCLARTANTPDLVEGSGSGRAGGYGGGRAGGYGSGRAGGYGGGRAGGYGSGRAGGYGLSVTVIGAGAWCCSEGQLII